MSTLSSEDRKKLDRLFGGLWGTRNGVKGSWGASSYRYHPTFIRRGPLLLTGQTRFDSLYVISPADAKLNIKYGHPGSNCDVFPTVDDGKIIQVWEGNDGPWWDMLKKEIPLMERELQETWKKQAEREREQKEKIENDRKNELELAKKSFEGSSK